MGNSNNNKKKAAILRSRSFTCLWLETWPTHPALLGRPSKSHALPWIPLEAIRQDGPAEKQLMKRIQKDGYTYVILLSCLLVFIGKWNERKLVQRENGTLWSEERGMATPLRQRTARESPQLETTILFRVRMAMTAVDPTASQCGVWSSHLQLKVWLAWLRRNTSSSMRAKPLSINALQCKVSSPSLISSFRISCSRSLHIVATCGKNKLKGLRGEDRTRSISKHWVEEWENTDMRATMTVKNAEVVEAFRREERAQGNRVLHVPPPAADRGDAILGTLFIFGGFIVCSGFSVGSVIVFFVLHGILLHNLGSGGFLVSLKLSISVVKIELGTLPGRVGDGHVSDVLQGNDIHGSAGGRTRCWFKRSRGVTFSNNSTANPSHWVWLL